MRKIEKKPRLLGIDLCRGLAAFAVIVVHSGDETWGVPINYWALQFRAFFYFAVPFFLAVSFLFTTRSIGDKISLQFIKTKSQRILIPYAVWSIFYICFGAIFFSMTNQPERLNELLQDPLAIILLGSASYHLYFLPLLFAGTLLVFPIHSLAKNKGITAIAFVAIISIIVNQIISWSGNSFTLNPPIAFPNLMQALKFHQVNYQITRFILMQVAWMLKCLPYICIAMILNYLLLKFPKALIKKKNLLILFTAIFVIVNIFRDKFIFNELSTVTVAFALLLSGICLSSYLKDSSMIRSLGNCSFGIYLIHPVLKKITTIVLTLIIPNLATQVTITSILCISIVTFLISWLVVLVCMQNKQLAKFAFGN